MLHLEQGGSVDLGLLLKQTEPQQLQLNGTVLSLEEGGSVDLSSLFLSSSDNQKLSIDNEILTLERGGSVDLSSIYTIPEPQKIDQFQLVSNTISLSS